DAEVASLQGFIAEYYSHLWAYWDLVSMPGTDETDLLARDHIGYLRRLREELGPRLTSSCFRTALERYRHMPGKSWPIRQRRHRNDCEQPYDPETGRPPCGCPLRFAWEPDEDT